MAGNTAMNYALVSSMIERFGAWSIYKNKLGGVKASYVKRNALGKLYDKTTKYIDDILAKAPGSGFYNPAGAVRSGRLLGNAGPGLVGNIVYGVSRALPLMAIESLQESMQLGYQEFLQSGYEGKDWLDGLTENGQLKDAIIGGAIGAMVIGPSVKGASRVGEAFENVGKYMADKTQPNVDKDGKVEVNHANKKPFMSWLTNTVFGKKKDLTQDVDVESEGMGVDADAEVGQFDSAKDLVSAIEAQWTNSGKLYKTYSNENQLNKKQWKDLGPI